MIQSKLAFHPCLLSPLQKLEAAIFLNTSPQVARSGSSFKRARILSRRACVSFCTFGSPGQCCCQSETKSATLSASIWAAVFSPCTPFSSSFPSLISVFVVIEGGVYAPAREASKFPEFASVLLGCLLPFCLPFCSAFCLSKFSPSLAASSSGASWRLRAFPPLRPAWARFSLSCPSRTMRFCSMASPLIWMIL